MKSIGILICTVFIVSLLAGCTTTQKSAGVGAVVGAGVGAIIGHQSGDTGEGALIGAGVGALTGALVGDAVEENQEEVIE